MTPLLPLSGGFGPIRSYGKGCPWPHGEPSITNIPSRSARIVGLIFASLSYPSPGLVNRFEFRNAFDFPRPILRLHGMTRGRFHGLRGLAIKRVTTMPGRSGNSGAHLIKLQPAPLLENRANQLRVSARYRERRDRHLCISGVANAGCARA